MSVVTPQNLVNINPKYPYGNVLTVKVLPPTANNGIDKTTTIITNMYFIEFMTNGEASQEECEWAQNPKFNFELPVALKNAFEFTQDLVYTLKAGESKSVTWKMKLQKAGILERMKKFIESIIPTVAAVSNYSLNLISAPRTNIATYPTTVCNGYASKTIYSENGGMISRQTEPDFPVIKE